MSEEFAIHIKNLTKLYGKLKAVDNISFSVKKGEFFSLLGQNGAGKSTTINILTGLGNKTSGEVTLFGKDVVKDYQEARQLIGLVPQEFNMDNFEIVERFMKFNAGYFGIVKPAKRIESLLKEMGIWEKRKSKIITLSGGMKRKLMIARALIHDPEILILDEPTAGVDVESRKTMWKSLKKLNKEGKTIILTTHYIEEAEQLCDRIAIIDNGKIIALDDKDKIMGNFGTEKLVITLAENLEEIPQNLKKYEPTVEGKKISFIIDEKIPYKTVLEECLKLPLIKIETEKTKLEDIFIELTHKKKEEDKTDE